MPGTPYIYQGTWDASMTSVPSASPSAGDVYRVSKTGTTSGIPGITEWYEGDHAVYLDGAWYKLDGIKRDIPSILDWGADPTGMTPSTAAIQNALDFIASVGGDLLFPVGDYLHSGLSLNTSTPSTIGYIRLSAIGNTGLSPATSGGVRLLCTSTTEDHLKIFTSVSVEIDGLGFLQATETAPTAGAAVNMFEGERVTLRNFFISGSFNGLLIDSVAVPIIENGDIQNLFGTDGVKVIGSTRTISQGRVDHLSINPGNGTIGSNCNGITIGDNANSITWIKIDISYALNGIQLGTFSGDPTQRPRFHRLYDISIENCEFGLIMLDGDGDWFTNLSIQSCAVHGIFVESTMDQIGSDDPPTPFGGPMFFDNPLIVGNLGHGVLLQGCPLISITGGIIANNSYGSAGSFDGVNVQSPKALLSIIGTRIGGDSTGQLNRTGDQGYGINITSAVTAPSLIIDNINGLGNVYGALFDGSGTANNNVVGTIVGLNKFVPSLPSALVNGSFQIWQRGTSFPLGAAAPCADYWVSRRGAGGGTVSQQSPGPLGSQYYIRLQRAYPDSMTNPLQLIQVLTRADSFQYVGTQIFLAFYARPGADFSGGTLQSQIVLGAGTTDQTASQALGGTWTNDIPYTQNNTLSPLAMPEWLLFTQPLNIPATIGSPALPTSQIGIKFYYTPGTSTGANDYVDIGLVSLQAGYGPPVIEIRPYGLDLAAAERRFRKSFPAATAPVTNAGLAGAAYVRVPAGLSTTTTFGLQVPLIPPMRAAPSVITYNPSGTDPNWYDSTNLASRPRTVANTADSGFTIDGMAGIAGSANFIHWTADAELT